MKIGIKVALALIGFVVLLTVGLLTWLTITDYKPNDVEKLTVENNRNTQLPDEITIFNWNIGYGALGQGTDFFFDGGETIITPESEYRGYMNGILDTIKDSEADILFFQEVDIDSKRSYYDNQLDIISNILPDYGSVFGTNYKVGYIPPPALFKESYGRVEAGLVMFSKYRMDESSRLSLPGGYSWPRSTLFLDRCMIVSRINRGDKNSIVLINTHNSAYDQGGFIKKMQLEFIKSFAETEYDKGNYVVIGGDWNSYMPGTDGETFKSEEGPSIYNQGLPKEWKMKGWNWAVDRKTPSSRSLKTPYVKGENFECVIDGFLLSPNIGIKSIKTEDLGFKFSDHNPIKLSLILN
ncbi:endonuclease/exonuclease/phosphatase family protein [Thiospirochaeta perfilievii]|uniref:Endonuclease/exonuclease/phosphatase family protein n=1 Tax=Thiospirochaeta perfilievii TaxID=252967 RepID=A0A5C1QB51_9SPIO|nr:endonuclease/exonuclease/phosphatase family protein [Thiospirochaeta perfilievii]QEN04280.1 endonuclease/exonuclease/phosphatase family protein [Thiospirochaeta perfilievii]